MPFPPSTKLISVISLAIAAFLQAPLCFAADVVQAQKLARTGYALIQDEDYDSATDILIRAAYADPGNLTVRRLLAEAQLRSGRASDCIFQLEALSKVQPNVPGDLVMLGQAYLSTGKNDLASRSYDQALRIQPTSIKAMLGLIDVLIAQGEYPRASLLCKRVLSIAKSSESIETANSKLNIIEQLCQRTIQSQS